MKNRWIKS